MNDEAPATYADGFTDGIEFVVGIVEAELEKARAEPIRPPTERNGRIAALGNLIDTIRKAGQ